MNANSANLNNKNEIGSKYVNSMNFNALNETNYLNNHISNSSAFLNQPNIIKDKKYLTDLGEKERRDFRNVRDSKNSNLKGRLDDAYSDLENLKRAIQDIKTSNENNRTNIPNKYRGLSPKHEKDTPIEFNYNNSNTNTNFQQNKFIQREREQDRHDYPIFDQSIRAGERNYNYTSNSENLISNNKKFSSYLNNPISSYNSDDSFNINSPGTGDNDEKRKTSFDVISNFKEVLKETEKFTMNEMSSPKNKRPNSMSKNEIMNISTTGNASYNNEKLKGYHNITDPLNESMQKQQLNNYIQKLNANNFREETERLRISNQVLNKSNLDLKNQNKILTMELESLKGNDIYNFTNNLNFDTNLNNFVDNLKNALNSSQMSNSEMVHIIDNLQKKIGELVNENNLLRDQFEISRNEIDNSNRRNTDMKMKIEELIYQNRQLENEFGKLELQFRDKEDKIKEENDRNENLMSINENNSKNQKDLTDMIENLKNTIDILKRDNTEFDQEKSKFKETIEQLNTEIENLNYEIENLTNTLQNIQKDREYNLGEAHNLKEEIKKGELYIKEMQENYKIVLADVEKYKGKLEVSNINLQDRENIIENLKISLNFITNTLNEYKLELDSIKNLNDLTVGEKTRISKNIDIYEKKIKDSAALVELLQKSKDEIMKKNLEIENELSEKRIRLNQLQFDYDLIKGRYSEQVEIICRLKEENKSNKNIKTVDEYTFNFMKNNDEKLKKIDELKQEIALRNKICDEHCRNFEESSKLKDNKIYELNYLLQTLNKNDGDIQYREIEFRNEISSLKIENDKLKKEIKGKEAIEKQMKETIELKELKFDVSKESSRERKIVKIIKNIDSSNVQRCITRKINVMKGNRSEVSGFLDTERSISPNVSRERITTSNLKSEPRNIELINSSDQVNTNLTNKFSNNININNISTLSIKTHEMTTPTSKLQNIQPIKILNTNSNNGNDKIYEIKDTYIINYDNLKKLSGSKNISNTSGNIDNTSKIVKNLNLKSNSNISNNIITNKDRIIYNDNKIIIDDPLARSDNRENNLYIFDQIFTIYDDKRILAYDLFNKNFRIFYPDDTCNFYKNYIREGSITLNRNGGLFILTGKSYNLLFFFDANENKIFRLQDLLYTHQYGGIIYFHKNNSILCISGKESKNVEKFSNVDFWQNYYKMNKGASITNEKMWSALPDMKCDRTKSGYIIINEKFLYVLFGYSYNKAMHLNTIDKLNLELEYNNPIFAWEEIKFIIPNSVPCYLESFITVQTSISDQIIIYGGYDGKNEINNKNILYFDVSKLVFEVREDNIQNKNANKFNFSKENVPSLFLDDKNRFYYAIFDNLFQIHLLDYLKLDHEIIKLNLEILLNR